MQGLTMKTSHLFFSSDVKLLCRFYLLLIGLSYPFLTCLFSFCWKFKNTCTHVSEIPIYTYAPEISKPQSRIKSLRTLHLFVGYIDSIAINVCFKVIS